LCLPMADTVYTLQQLYTQLTGSSRCFLFPFVDGGRRGLLGMTKDFSPDLITAAYLQGVFPWFDEEQDPGVLWWSPDPRFVLPADSVHVSERLERFLKHSPFTLSVDRDFSAVIRGCAEAKRKGQDGTWIGSGMIEAYSTLHERGIAHSVEAWQNGVLAGGFYGVLIGRVFFGESMFTVQSNAAKECFVRFARAFAACGGQLIDCQVYTDNMARYGARNISREAFLHMESELLFGTQLRMDDISGMMEAE